MKHIKTYIVMGSSFRWFRASARNFPLLKNKDGCCDLKTTQIRGFKNTNLWMELILLQNLTRLECPLDITLQGGFA